MQNSKIDKIEWTNHTFNPWGPAQTTQRRAMSASYWQQPHKWHADALRDGERRRVFCASMADVFEDHPQVVPWRVRLFEMIEKTPMLDWLLLTKRPQNMTRFTPARWADAWPANVWAMTSVENQEQADKRIPELLRVPARVRGLSCEPLLGPVDLVPWLFRPAHNGAPADLEPRGDLHWVIVGGESGHGARPMDVEWARSLRDQCQDASVAFFMKQMGGARDKGGDLDAMPEDLRVREFPN